MSITIESATRDLKAAEENQAGLLRALQAGDTKITGADLAEADSAVRVAALRLDAAERIAAEAIESARLERIEQWRQFIRENYGAHEGSIVEAFDAAVVALAPLIAAVRQHNAGRRQVIAELHALKPLPADLNVDRDRGHLRLTNLDVQIQDEDAESLLAEACWRALTASGDPAEKVVALASTGVDHHTSALLGIEPRADGVAMPHARSDWLRYIAGRVAERDGEA